MNPNTTLCLACSSSLPPRLLMQTDGKRPTELFLTKCCARPICPTCLAHNPRLARYDPCLACLGGIRAVGSSQRAAEAPRNIDAAVRDEDVYAIGNDEDEEDIDAGEPSTGSSGSSDDLPAPTTPPPAYATELPTDYSVNSTTNQFTASGEESTTNEKAEEGSSSRYYIRKGDTLLGIALRHGVDGRTLCKLNNLPPSTLNITPHILHTRTFLTLPPSAKSGSTSPPPPPDPEMEARRARERARKRFQFVTKEVDWRVAQAYVALADDEAGHADRDARNAKAAEKEKAEVTHDDDAPPPARLEGRAVDSYLDDAEWEERERRAGRGVRIERLPVASGSSRREDAKKASGWSWRG
ncbi:hypothetical protein PENSPDRAFT_745393 [Peniophora sp. CONT]|nr:hypothetical protein PENSPDRAFT_745393 [Peniophora sp. CONT]